MIGGLPKLVDYHIMNNKRFVLTVDERGLVQLWQAETGNCVKEFPNQKFSSVKAHLSDLYDMKHSKESPLPGTWMSVDIKLGSLTIHMEDTNWAKGQVDRHKSDVVQLMKRSLTNQPEP